VKSSYDIALKAVLEDEGGYSNDPGDPGGPTNWGITIYDARAYWKKNATAADVRTMPLEVAKDIYRSKYWDAMDCDDLPAGVDYCVFDYGVNSGISRSMKVLQRIVGTKADGAYGPKTEAAIKAYGDMDKLINAICDERLSFLQGLSTWRIFGKGWGRRVKHVRTIATTLAEQANGPSN
jgi:lysozyme family protein